MDNPTGASTPQAPLTPFPSGVSSDTPSTMFPAQPSAVPSPAQTPAPIPTATPAPSIPPIEAAPPPPPTVQPPTASTGPTVTPSGGGRGKKLILFLVMLLIVLGIGAAAVFLLPRLTSITNKQATLTWWGLWEDTSIVQPVIDEYQSAHPGVTITYVPQSKEDYRERLTNAFARGEGPDIFEYHNTWVPMFRTTLATLPASVMTAQDFSQTFYPVMTSDLTLQSGIVGMPIGYDGLAMYVNDDILATYSKTVPSTWNELRETAIALTIKDQNGVIQQSGVAMGQTSNVDHWPEILGLMMLQNGANMTNPTGELAEGALTFFSDMSVKYGVWDSTLPSSTIAFAAGKLAFYFAPSWRAYEIAAQNPNLKFRVLPMPQLPKDLDPNEPDSTYATYWVNGVSEKSEGKDTAWDFLKFLSSKESLEKLAKNATAVRSFGRPYPRVDMRDIAKQDPRLAGFIELAPSAKSWYLASRTFDGVSGINSQINKYFEDALNSLSDGRGDPTSALTTAAAGVQQVLVQYELIAPPPPTTTK